MNVSARAERAEVVERRKRRGRYFKDDSVVLINDSDSLSRSSVEGAVDSPGPICGPGDDLALDRAGDLQQVGDAFGLAVAWIIPPTLASVPGKLAWENSSGPTTGIASARLRSSSNSAALAVPFSFALA